MKLVRKRLTYANVMSTLAVFLVLGGATAVAASKIGANEIKANAIVTGKIKKEAITEGKIKPGAVGNTRLADGSVTATKLAPGAIGAGQLGTFTVQTAVTPIANNGTDSANVACLPGQKVISGGGAWTAAADGLSYLSSRPIRSTADLNAMVNGDVPGGWRSTGTNKSGAANAIQVWVICLG